MIGPEIQRVTTPNQDLNGTADFISLNIITCSERISTQVVHDTGEDFLFLPGAAPKNFDDVRGNKDAIGHYFLAFNSLFQVCKDTQFAGESSSIRRVICFRQAGSCSSRRCIRKAANLSCSPFGRLAISRINSAILTR